MNSIAIDGNIAGNGFWTFDPQEEKIKACFKWVVKPKRLMHVLLSPFVDMGAIHSEVMINGYAALNKYLEKGS